MNEDRLLSTSIGDENLQVSSVLAPFTANSNSVIQFKLIRSEADIDDESKQFPPEFTHQVYANEQIFGYKNLSIHLYYLACSMDLYFEATYDEQIKTQKKTGRFRTGRTGRTIAEIFAIIDAVFYQHGSISSAIKQTTKM